jgi:CO dehydrogenase maturation factor
MGKMIAISGKGGVGKTTISALVIRQLIARKLSPVLAVDADPNSCLDAALGVKVVKTIGSGREEARQVAGSSAGQVVPNVSKQEMLEMKIAECLVESNDFDLIAMGRPEGPGCYCYANNVLKSALQTITAQYPYVVLDNEAGLENLSRRIVQKVDLLVLVADSSMRSLETLRRLYYLAREMGTQFERLSIVVNRTRDGTAPQYAFDVKDEIGADQVVALPDDREVGELAEQGRSVFDLSDSNPVLARIGDFIGSNTL